MVMSEVDVQLVRISEAYNEGTLYRGCFECSCNSS